MIRAPSLQREFDYVCSFDDALATPPADAHEEAKTAFAAAFGRALELANWSEVLDPGKTPTRFALRLIAGEPFRRLVVDSSKGFNIEVQALAFRMGVRGVSGMDGAPTLSWTKHERYGDMLTSEAVAFFDGIDRNIVNEVGSYILSRSISIGPKS